jgi:PKHD-type hydroxylase
MRLINHYWYFKSAIPNHICDQIIEYGKSKNENTLGLIGSLGIKRDTKEKPLTKKEIKDLKKTRNSNIVWLSEPWIYKEIHPYINLANKNAGWNFEWDWSEACQFTKYGKGQYYDWHSDCLEKPYEDPDLNINGKIRKLSATINLSDPKDYKGGELEFDFKNQYPNKKPNIRTCTEILPKGSLVVFPSFVWHRVKPVTKGVRYSLVIWNLGYPFK